MNKPRPDDSSQDDLNGLSTPVHLDAQPNDCRHDPVQYRPEAASHTPYSAAEDREANMLVRARPTSDYGDESSDYGDADHQTHGLRNAETESEE